MKFENMHIHSKYSWDCKMELNNIATKLIENNVKYAAITDHVEFRIDSVISVLWKFQDRDLAINEINKLNKNKLKILKAMEISEPHLYEQVINYFNVLDLDFIMGSIHKIDRTAKQDLEKQKATMLYYKEILKMISAKQIDVVGHLDYINRYYGNDYSDKEQVKEVIDAIIENNMILEINTSAKRRCNQDTFPSIDKLTYYKEQGGKYVTIGTDAHREEELTDNLELGHKIAKDLGLTPVVYKKRKIEII